MRKIKKINYTKNNKKNINFKDENIFSDLNFQKQINDMNKKLDEYNLLVLNLFSSLKSNQNTNKKSNNNNKNTIDLNSEKTLNKSDEKHKKYKNLIPIYDANNKFTGYYRDINYNYDSTKIKDLQNEILNIKQQRIKDKNELINKLNEIKDIKEILINEMNNIESYNSQNYLRDFQHYNFDNEMYKINNPYRVIKSNLFGNKYIDDYYPKVLRRNNPGNYYPKYLNQNNLNINYLNHSHSLKQLPSFFNNQLNGSIILKDYNKNNSILPNINSSNQILNNSNLLNYEKIQNIINNNKSMMKFTKNNDNSKNIINSYNKAKKFMRFSELNN